MPFPSVRGLIAAFGDFDSDKLTDVFVIKQNLKTFQVMKQFEKEPFLRRSNVQCRPFRSEFLIGLIPGDFHGNAMMDLVLISQESSKKFYNLRILSGNTTDFHCRGIWQPPFAKTSSQPLMIDFNGDMISDLLADDAVDGQRSVWLGQANGTFTRVPFMSSSESVATANQSDPNLNYEIKPIANPNSNAFIDLNGDGVADLFIMSTDHMEYWFADHLGHYGNSKPVLIPYPNRTRYNVQGASAFFDIDGDHEIEHLIPVCESVNHNCTILGLEMIKSDDGDVDVFRWTPIVDKFLIKHNQTDVELSFKEVVYNEFLTLPITIRHGDINGDGYADIVTLMTSPDGHDLVILLENVESDSNFLKRTFKLFDGQPKFARPLIAAFFDLKEDSQLDLLATSRTETITNHTIKPDLTIDGELNAQMLDANFLKVLVASGRCPNNECYKEG